MFLFLSKLLPLFIYPVGLTCVLLLLAIFSLWKHPRRAVACMLTAIAVILISGNGWVANAITQSLEWQNIPPKALPNTEAIVVLGGAIKPQMAPRPWVDVMESGDRVLHGAQLYREGKAPLVIMSGGRIHWKGGGPPESADMAALAQTMGVPASAILQDPTSLNTYENAVNVKQILQQRGIRRILLVTSAMHMPRSLAIFKKQGIEAIAAPTDFLVTQQELQEPGVSVEAVLLNLIPDADRIHQTTRALKEYIGLVVYRLRGWL